MFKQCFNGCMLVWEPVKLLLLSIFNGTRTVLASVSLFNRLQFDADVFGASKAE